jgi:GDP-4-dehydro-6-deoxy-D-mannose reductase
VTHAGEIAAVVQACQPQRIFHLAGLVRGTELAALWRVNVQGTANLLDAARQLASPPRLVIPGSAAEYGLLADEQPVTETALTRPLNPYGVSKVAQTLLALGYAWRGELPVVVGRVFNITGPAEPAAMLGGAMAAQIAAIERGEQAPVLSVGNLAPTRDYIDIRDMVQALWLLSERGTAGEIYNICSGQAVQVAAVVAQLADLGRVPITIQPDPARQRPSDIPHCVGNPAKLHAATGWQPTFGLTNSLADLLDWWRGEGRKGVRE